MWRKRSRSPVGDDDLRGGAVPAVDGGTSPLDAARRGLEQGDLLAAARALARTGAATPSTPIDHRAEAARQLCLAGVEHERQAAALEEAVAAHRVAARRARDEVEALLHLGRRDTRSGPAGPTDDAASPADAAGSVPSPPVPTASTLSTLPVLALVPALADRTEPHGDPDGGERLVARLLGTFEVEWRGRVVSEWGSLKGRAVLQYLLVDPHRPVRRDVLMELLWPGHPPESARNNLNVAIYALRRTLSRANAGPNVVIHRDGCYLLNPELAVETDREELLAELAAGAGAQACGDVDGAIAAVERAVARYRGPLFEDDTCGEWYFEERRLLEERVLEAHERLATLRIERDEPADALLAAQAALRLDPCRESAHRIVMCAYASLHQTQSVARQYRLCVQALEAHLGLGPAAETTLLFHQLANVS